MTTLQQMVDEVRDSFLFQDSPPELNQLAASCESTDTTLTFLNPVGSMQVSGTRIAIDYEEMRVWTTSGSQATLVERAVSSSTAAAHTNGTLVEIGGKYTQYRVMNAINEELAHLSGAGLFAVGEEELTYNPAVQGYDLGTIQWDDIIDLRYEIPGPSKNWPFIRQYSKLFNADTSQFPSGNGLVVYQAAFPGLPIRVRYRGPFTTLTGPSQDVTLVGGLPSTASDLPVLGAAIRLGAPGEITRNFLRAQRDPMLLEDVPPGAILNSTKNLMALYQQRLVAEAGRLARIYPKVAPL